jgi:hypothetical protein
MSAPDEFADKTSPAVRTTEFCQSLFDEGEIIICNTGCTLVNNPSI